MNRPTYQPVLTAPSQGPEVDPSDLWLALQSLPRPHKVVPFPRNLPGTDVPAGELAMWPLSQEEQMACNAEADRFTKKLLKDPQQRDQANLGYHHTYSNETAVQVLYRACRNIKDLSRSAFPSPTAIRAELTTDEVGVLFNHYLTVQSEVGPIAAHLSPEELEGMILRLQAGGSMYPFDTLSWEEQRTLVSSMASRLVSCWTAMFSAGLPLDATTYLRDRLAEISTSPTASTQQGATQASADAADDTDPTIAPPDPADAVLDPVTPEE